MTLGAPFRSIGSALSADGSMVVGWTQGPDTATRWTPSGSSNTLGGLPGASYSGARGISADGSVIVGVSGGGSWGTPSAVRWSNLSGAQYLGPGEAWSVSADGSTIVGSSGGTAAVWGPSGFMSLGSLGGSSSTAYASSGTGTIVVGESASAEGNRAFAWSAATGMRSLGTLPGGSGSRAADVSADGSVVVGFCNSDGGRAAIWHATFGAMALYDYLQLSGTDMSGWSSLHMATAVSGDGRLVVGMGRFNGQIQGFIADIGVIPAPGAIALLGFVGLAASRGRRRGHEPF